MHRDNHCSAVSSSSTSHWWRKMHPSCGNCSKLRRFIIERAGIISADMPAAFLLTTLLTALALFLTLTGCSSTPAPPINTRLPTPTDTPTPATSPTGTPTLLPPATLEGPENGSCLECESEVRLYWSTPYVLQPNEYYRVRVWAKGRYSAFHYHKEDHFTLPSLLPGEYNWSVAIVRSTAQDEYELVSEESEWYSFEIVPPPVVRGISPMSTMQGTSVAVVVSGENFTRSLALAIGVPLQASFVNSSTITATIPTTLEVGKYSVIVKDSLGQGDSYASFTVSERPTLVPTVQPRYAQPVLGGVDIFGSDVTFHWSWTGNLAAHEYFALRVGIGTPRESKLWTKETQASWRLTEQGDHVWEVAICRGDPAKADCSGNKQLVVSERGTLGFTPPRPHPTPKPP